MGNTKQTNENVIDSLKKLFEQVNITNEAIERKKISLIKRLTILKN